MKYSVTKNSETKVTLKISVTKEELADAKKLAVTKLSKKVKAAGFRPGKVPANVAEKHIDPNELNSQVVEDTINKYVIEAVTTEKLQPIDQPKVEVGEYLPGKNLEFTAELEVLPEVKLGDYKKLKAKKEKLEVAEKEIDDTIERMRLGMSTKKVVEREAGLADEVSIDFEGKDEKGEPVTGASGKDYALVLGSNSFIPGFEEGLVGKKAGDKFDLPLTFPKDYHHAPLAGAKVTFAVTVNEVREIGMPEVDDAFAAKCGPFKTVAELRADVKRELLVQKERRALEDVKEDLVNQLVDATNPSVPEVLVVDQVASLERDFVQNLLYRGMTLEQFLDEQKLDKDAWREKELRPQAERRVKTGLTLAELSRAEKVEVTREDVEARLAEMMQQYGNSAEISQQLQDPETQRAIANRLATEKTIERLAELNTK